MRYAVEGTDILEILDPKGKVFYKCGQRQYESLFSYLPYHTFIPLAPNALANSYLCGLQRGVLVMIDAFENHKSKTMDQFANANVVRIRIAKDLLELGTTQKDLAKALGVTPATIWHVPVAMATTSFQLETQH